MEYLEPLRRMYEQASDASVAAGARKYMRNLFEFYGLKAPLRRAIQQQFVSKYGYPQPDGLEKLVKYCWQQQEREWQYFAMEMFARHARKCEPGMLELAEWMVVTKSWWDSVDFIATQIIGVMLRNRRKETREWTDRWMDSGNLWLQRVCLIFQLPYNRDTDTELLFSLCNRLSGHPDFFIRKAIGWSLRQYAKTDLGRVVSFVESHTLSPLSRSEALKNVK